MCNGASGWGEPNYATRPNYEPTEASCDSLDNDCDGLTDENVSSSELASNQNGVCAGSKKVCSGGTFVDPDPSTLAFFETSESTCDGRDNDCDGATDEGLTAPLAAKQQGVCAGAVKVCGGSSGWVEPDYATINGYQSSEGTDCDGKDNDCDGLIDEGADSDGDGYYKSSVPSCVALYSTQNKIDCDDAAPNFNATCIVFVDDTATGANTGGSWANAKTSLMSALSIAKAGYEVWVAAGRYVPDAATYPYRFVMKQGVPLYGGFAGTETLRTQRDWTVHVSRLSADVNGDDGPAFTNRADNLAGIIQVPYTSDEVIDGFTISGSTDGPALKTETGHATVANCTFTDNTTTSYLAPALDGYANITDSHFIGNRSTGGSGAVSLQTGTCLRCTFRQNVGTTGGAMTLGGQTGTEVRDSLFEENSATTGGAIATGDAAPRILNSRFLRNSAQNGGAIFFDWRYAPQVAGCLFNGNTATVNGGAIYARGTQVTPMAPTIINSTLANNSAGDGGAIYASVSGPGSVEVTLVNSVVARNSPNQFASSGANMVKATYTCIDQNTNGTGVVKLNGADPFVDSNGADNVGGNADDDLHLPAGSACVDSGNNASVPSDLTVDLDAKPRLNGTVDRGAYER